MEGESGVENIEKKKKKTRGVTEETEESGGGGNENRPSYCLMFSVARHLVVSNLWRKWRGRFNSSSDPFASPRGTRIDTVVCRG